jgi:DNA repair exonuclease SbcCD nuclease subunit
LFDRSLPVPLAIRQFRQAVKVHLAPHDIPLILLAGNHDTATCARGARPEFLARWQKSSTHHLLQAQGLAIFLNDSSYILRDATGNIIAAFLGLRFHGKTSAGRLQDLVKQERIKLFDGGSNAPRIALLHLLVKGVPLPVFDSRPEDLDPSGMFHYIGVGHWHQRLDLPDYHIFCPGATEHTSPMDWNHVPGYFSVRMRQDEEWLPHVEYRVLPGIRPKESVELSFPPDSTPTEADVRKLMLAHNRPGGIVRYQVQGAFPPNWDNLHQIVRESNNWLLKYYFVQKRVKQAGVSQKGDQLASFIEGPVKKSLQVKLDEFY